MRTKTEIHLIDFPFPDTTDQERLVLADLMLAASDVDDIIGFVHPDFFTNDARRTIWTEMVDRHNRGESLEASALYPILGPAFNEEVVPMMGEAAGSMAALEHAVNLRNAAAKRRAYLAATSFLQSSLNSSTDEQTILSSVETFAKSVEGPAPLQGEKPIAAVLDEVREQVEQTEQAVRLGMNIRVTTGFRYLNEILNGGFKPGQLVVLAARPSVGKTALMLQMAKAAASAGEAVQVFSLEMTADELAERLLFATGEVRPFQVNFGQVEWQAYHRAEDSLKPLPFYINDFSRSLDDIVTRLTLAVKKDRCKVAYIDYLGLMQDALTFGGNQKLYQVIARITGTLKATAKRLRIPIVLLCQLNRDAAREKRAPELFDLRDSGSIEQDADVVGMLESKMATESRIILWLRKNRAGKKDVGFVYVPNDTYSAFEEGCPVDQLRDPGQLHEDLPAPSAVPDDLPAEPSTSQEDYDDNLPF